MRGDPCKHCGLNPATGWKYCDHCKPLAQLEKVRAWTLAHPSYHHDYWRRDLAENRRKARERSAASYVPTGSPPCARKTLLLSPNALLHCPGCERDLSVGWFHHNGRYRDGVRRRQYLCRECVKPAESMREARRRGAIGRFTRLDIVKIRRAQGGRCALCARPLIATGEHIDHIHPVSKGGSNWPANIQLLCPRCNLKKSASIADAGVQKYL